MAPTFPNGPLNDHVATVDVINNILAFHLDDGRVALFRGDPNFLIDPAHPEAGNYIGLTLAVFPDAAHTPQHDGDENWKLGVMVDAGITFASEADPICQQIKAVLLAQPGGQATYDSLRLAEYLAQKPVTPVTSKAPATGGSGPAAGEITSDASGQSADLSITNDIGGVGGVGGAGGVLSIDTMPQVISVGGGSAGGAGSFTAGLSPAGANDVNGEKPATKPSLVLSADDHAEAKSIMTRLDGFIHALSGDVKTEWNRLRTLLHHGHGT